jgi:hypothetical protein
MAEGEPVGGDAKPVGYGQGVEDGQGGTVGDFRDQTCRDRAFGLALVNAGIGPQGLLDGADNEVDPERKQDDRAEGRQDGLERRVGQIGKEVVPPRRTREKRIRSPVMEPIPQARVWRQPPIMPLRMASMLTGPIGAAATNPIKNAAESTWM